MTILPAHRRTIVIGDLHGDVGMMCAALFLAKIIDQDLQWIAEPKDTIVVQMGDQVDSQTRGTLGEAWERVPDLAVVEFLKRVDDMARPHGGRVISLLGNHELMNVIGDFSYASPFSIEKSGGVLGRNNLFRPGGSIARLLAERPLVARIGHIVFVHAGLLPQHFEAFSTIEAMNAAVSKWLLGAPVPPALIQWIMHPDSPVWTRLLGEAPEKEAAPILERALERAGAAIMIVGHQPQPRISQRFNGRVWFADVGLSRAFGSFSDQLSVLEIFQDGHTVDMRTISAPKKVPGARVSSP